MASILPSCRRSTRSSPAPLVRAAAFPSPIGVLRLFVVADGLLTIALPNESREAAEARVRRLLGEVAIVEDRVALAPAIGQLAEYFAGARRVFDLPLAPRGTPFQRAVWNAVMTVPYGETRTYGAIAAQLGRPTAVRAVGAANGANPLPPIVPCHRLVGADGSLRGYGGGLAVKEALLALEQN